MNKVTEVKREKKSVNVVTTGFGFISDWRKFLKSTA